VKRVRVASSHACSRIGRVLILVPSQVRHHRQFSIELQERFEALHTTVPSNVFKEAAVRNATVLPFAGSEVRRSAKDRFDLGRRPLGISLALHNSAVDTNTPFD